jgi:hypothetical protein
MIRMHIATGKWSGCPASGRFTKSALYRTSFVLIPWLLVGDRKKKKQVGTARDEVSVF